MDTCLLDDRATIKACIQTVTDYAQDRYSRIKRSDVLKWNLEDEEYDKLTFDEHGYLNFAVDDVYVDEIVHEHGMETYYIIASLYAGKDFTILIGDPDIYEAYKDDEGWSVEWHGC